MNSPTHKDYDVLIVGGGPAGATTARYAALAGLRVLIVDKKSELGTPVQCSGAVSANALTECDVPFDDEFIAEPIFGFVTYSDSGEEMRIDYRNKGRTEPLGYVVDRKRFDRYLTRMAVSAGAELWMKARASGFQREDGGIVLNVERFGQKYQLGAKVVVGADGVMSQVGLWAGLQTAIPLEDVASCLQYIIEGVETHGLLEIVTGHAHAPGGYAWLFPKGYGMAEVGLGVLKTMTDQDARWHLDRFMTQSFMKERLRGAKVIEVQGGGVPLAQPMKKIYADNVIIVGDAGRQVNPLTGGGIHTAMRGGRLAGEFLGRLISGAGSKTFSSEELSEYQMRWHEQIGSPLSDLYQIRTRIFEERDTKKQDRALFQTLGGYFSPESRYRKV